MAIMIYFSMAEEWKSIRTASGKDKHYKGTKMAITKLKPTLESAKNSYWEKVNHLSKE